MLRTVLREKLELKKIEKKLDEPLAKIKNLLSIASYKDACFCFSNFWNQESRELSTEEIVFLEKNIFSLGDTYNEKFENFLSNKINFLEPWLPRFFYNVQSIILEYIPLEDRRLKRYTYFSKLLLLAFEQQINLLDRSSQWLLLYRYQEIIAVSEEISSFFKQVEDKQIREKELASLQLLRGKIAIKALQLGAAETSLDCIFTFLPLMKDNPEYKNFLVTAVALKKEFQETMKHLSSSFLEAVGVLFSEMRDLAKDNRFTAAYILLCSFLESRKPLISLEVGDFIYQALLSLEKDYETELTMPITGPTQKMNLKIPRFFYASHKVLYSFTSKAPEARIKIIRFFKLSLYILEEKLKKVDALKKETIDTYCRDATTILEGFYRFLMQEQHATEIMDFIEIKKLEGRISAFFSEECNDSDVSEENEMNWEKATRLCIKAQKVILEMADLVDKEKRGTLTLEEQPFVQKILGHAERLFVDAATIEDEDIIEILLIEELGKLRDFFEPFKKLAERMNDRVLKDIIVFFKEKEKEKRKRKRKRKSIYFQRKLGTPIKAYIKTVCQKNKTKKKNVTTPLFHRSCSFSKEDKEDEKNQEDQEDQEYTSPLLKLVPEKSPFTYSPGSTKSYAERYFEQARWLMLRKHYDAASHRYTAAINTAKEEKDQKIEMMAQIGHGDYYCSESKKDRTDLKAVVTSLEKALQCYQTAWDLYRPEIVYEAIVIEALRFQKDVLPKEIKRIKEKIQAVIREYERVKAEAIKRKKWFNKKPKDWKPSEKAVYAFDLKKIYYPKLLNIEIQLQHLQQISLAEKPRARLTV